MSGLLYNEEKDSGKGWCPMLQEEKARAALAAIEACCGHCAYCSPDCPVFIARRAMEGLLYDMESVREQDPGEKENTR